MSEHSDEIERLRAVCDRQRQEITVLNETLHRKNVALDALHMVWCDGGCPGGVHRWTAEGVTEEVVSAAERNTARLRRWFDAARHRLANHPETDEWRRQYHDDIRAKLGEERCS